MDASDLAKQPVSIDGRSESPHAVIGPRIQIRGELYGEEDILIQGRVEGKIEVKDNTLTIGPGGSVKANIGAREITVEGEVKGDVFADECVNVKETSNVRGNLVAPRISLADGAKFKGSIDMNATERNRAKILGEKETPNG